MSFDILALEIKHMIIKDVELDTIGPESPAVSKAISNTPAPRLVSFTLDLDEKQLRNNNILQLFKNDAPNLTSARIHACRLINGLPDFPSLAELLLRVTESNLPGLLDMLRRMPRLTHLSLKGANRWDNSPLPIHDPALETVILPLCRSLLISFMTAHRTRFILSHIDLPAVTHLDVRETIVEDEHGLVATIFDTLPKLPDPPPQSEPRDWIFIGIRSDQLAIQFLGYRFQTQWTNFTFATIADANVAANTLFSLIVDAVCAPADILFLQPTRLYIENSITLDEGGELFMGLDDLRVLLGDVFHTYPSIQRLSLSGNTAPITRALHFTYPDLLPNLASLDLQISERGNLPGIYDGPSLALLQHSRHLEIDNQL
ncbi:hypothetical protein SISSUDRAFT_1055451, partial [Sistotremastrum suecicum HHB10207 ss-3]